MDCGGANVETTAPVGSERMDASVEQSGSVVPVRKSSGGTGAHVEAPTGHPRFG